MIYRLQGCKKSAVIGWMAGMLLLAGCTQDKLADASQGEVLPEGKYPVTFTATGLGTTATTRATSGDTWDGNEAVAVQVEVDGTSEVKNYIANGSGTSTTLEPADTDNTFYWQSTSDIKVSAWYPGTEYGKEGSLPTKWSVKTNQNSSNGYQESDFLYAPQTDIDFKGTKPLIFYHQTAKVVVNICKQGVANDKDKIISVTINAVTDGVFTTNLTKNCGLSAKTGVNPSGINSFKLGNPNKSVVFKDGENAEDALASYQALVIPQTLGSNTPIEIKIEGYDTFKYTPTEILAGGTQYTYNLTIDGKEVTATVTADNMTWTVNNSGTGSVTLPKTIDLSKGEDVNITDNGSYLITGTGSKTIKVSGSPTIFMQDVNLTTFEAPLCITSGTPTLVIKGTTNLEATGDYKAGIELRGNTANVNIEGDGNLVVKTVSEGAGIGSGRTEPLTCGNITIKGITADITTKDAAGIGCCKEGGCGNIKIENASIKITVKGMSAGIGCGYWGNWNLNQRSCGNIDIVKSSLNINISNNVRRYPAAIGCSASQYGGGICGTVTITLKEDQNESSFLGNMSIKVGDETDDKCEKIGLGYDPDTSPYYFGEIGDIIWKDSNNTEIKRIPARPVKE